MASAVVQSGVCVSKFVNQQWQSTSSGVSHVSITRMPSEPENGEGKFTCRRTNIVSLAGKIIIHDAALNKDIKRPCDSAPTPFIPKVETSGEYRGSPPLEKRRRLVFIPVRSGLSDAELVWHGKNIENLLRNDNSDCSNFTQSQNNVHADSDDLTPRVLIIRGGDKIVQALELHETNEKEPLVQSQLEPVEKVNPEIDEVPEDLHPAVHTANSGETESAEVEVDDGSVFTPECFVLLSEDSIVVSPPVPVHSELQNSKVVDQHPRTVNEHSSTQCMASLSGTNLQPGELENVDNKCSLRNTNFDFGAIAKNLDVDGCISSYIARTDIEEVREVCVGSQVPTVHTKSKVPVKLAVVNPCETNSNDFVEPSNLEKTNLKSSSQIKNFHFRAIAENLDVDGCIRSDDLDNRFSTYEKVKTKKKEVREDCVVSHVLTPNNSHKVPTNWLELSKSCYTGSNGSDALPLPATVDSEMGFTCDCTSSIVESRCSTNKGAQCEGVDSQVPANSDFDIPTVVQEFTANSALNPSKLGSKRKNAKRRKKQRRKCEKRARTEFLASSPDVTEYTSFFSWAGGKVIVSTPKTSKEEGNSTQPVESDAVSALIQDSRGISTDVGNVGRACFIQEQEGGIAFHGDHSEGREPAGASAFGNVSSDGSSAETHKSLSTKSNNGISVTMSANKTFLSDTNPVEALFYCKNHLSEKVAKTDAKLTGELGGMAEKVQELSDFQELDASLVNFSYYLDPETLNDTSIDIINTDGEMKNELSEELSGEAENIVELCGSQQFDASLKNLSFVDPENMKDIAVSFRSYIRSLVRPEGFPGHLQMKLKCFLCGILFPCFVELEGHCVESHQEAWKNIRNSYLRILVPYSAEGFIDGYPQLKFKCVFCSKLFSNCTELEEHKAERHYGDDPYECPICFERFNNAVSYSSHLTEHICRNDYPSLTCSACCVCFSSQWQLDPHSQTQEPHSDPITVDF